MPELIFNQSPSEDLEGNRRHFETDNQVQWKVFHNESPAQQEECYVCDK